MLCQNCWLEKKKRLNRWHTQLHFAHLIYSAKEISYILFKLFFLTVCTLMLFQI